MPESIKHGNAVVEGGCVLAQQCELLTRRGERDREFGVGVDHGCYIRSRGKHRGVDRPFPVNAALPANQLSGQVQLYKPIRAGLLEADPPRFHPEAGGACDSGRHMPIDRVTVIANGQYLAGDRYVALERLLTRGYDDLDLSSVFDRCSSRATSMIMSSWPPTICRRPSSTRRSIAGTPYRLLAASAWRRK